MRVEEFAERDRATRAAWLSAFERGDADDAADPWAPGPIVRLYSFDYTDRTQSITDLRTGVVERNASGLPHFLWLYAALPAAERLVL
jgi:hypothetical protein